MLKRFDIFFSILRELCGLNVDKSRRKNGGDADVQIGQRAEIHFELGVLSYAAGGAREARCRENESLGAASCGREEYQATTSNVLLRSNRAAANAGRWSAWQIWQAPFGP